MHMVAWLVHGLAVRRLTRDTIIRYFSMGQCACYKLQHEEEESLCQDLLKKKVEDRPLSLSPIS